MFWRRGEWETRMKHSGAVMNVVWVKWICKGMYWYRYCCNIEPTKSSDLSYKETWCYIGGCSCGVHLNKIDGGGGGGSCRFAYVLWTAPLLGWLSQSFSRRLFNDAVSAVYRITEHMLVLFHDEVGKGVEGMFCNICLENLRKIIDRSNLIPAKYNVSCFSNL